MKKSTCLGYFCLSAILLVSAGIQQTRAQQKGFKQVRRATFLMQDPSAQKGVPQKVRSNVDTAKAGQLTTGEPTSVIAANAPTSGAKAVRRDASRKVTKGDRPGTQSAAPKMEMSEGLEQARAPVSPRENFGGKQ